LQEVLDGSTGTHATAGVAEWKGDISPSDLVREADRALLYGKQQGIRGRAVSASTVPADFSLGRPFGADDRPSQSAAGANWPSAVREETETLRERAHQLSLANSLGARIAGMTRVADAVDAAVQELREGFGYSAVALVRAGELTATPVAERSLLEQRPVAAGSEVALPIWIGEELWGALNIRDEGRSSFDEADVRVLESVAAQLGSALQSAMQHERLERAYLATAEALGAALEAKDATTAEHARSIVKNAEAVGRRLGMTGDELRDLRYAAAFHDIGKVAVSDQILNKPGPLTEAEKREVERHTLVGAQILADVDFLSGVLPLVRHCHERWDGAGYPDGLAGDRIPLGARVILVCDAHDAMTADRPYRRALAPEAARAEIRSASGREFDSRVADAFLEAVGSRRVSAT
jgi:hypothetical protein